MGDDGIDDDRNDGLLSFGERFDADAVECCRKSGGKFVMVMSLLDMCALISLITTSHQLSFVCVFLLLPSKSRSSGSGISAFGTIFRRFVS